MRTHYCGLVTASLTGQQVTVAGWVHRRRDHGGVIFVDLRDREGLLQVVCNPDAAEVFATAEKLRNEFVVQVTGTVRERPAGTSNANLATGQVEVVASAVEILNRADPLPFQLDEQVSEEVRLRYRYLDLRREVMGQRLRQRHAITRSMRGFLDSHGFVDVETPMLTKATPEGARDYLVPSRTHAGKFFALPQSPQIFKQLLMVAGLERYYQIVRCFRDEDLRADRQPEFTQLDIETSFLSQDQITALMESLVRQLFREVLGQELPEPFPRMSYHEAMRRFGAQVLHSGSGNWSVFGLGVGGWAEPKDILDFGNSGTGSRLVMGAMATTRLSLAPVSQVVHPRLEAPDTTKRFRLWCRLVLEISCTASIARTALFTMGKSKGQE